MQKTCFMTISGTHVHLYSLKIIEQGIDIRFSIP